MSWRRPGWWLATWQDIRALWAYILPPKPEDLVPAEPPVSQIQLTAQLQHYVLASELDDRLSHYPTVGDIVRRLNSIDSHLVAIEEIITEIGETLVSDQDLLNAVTAALVKEDSDLNTAVAGLQASDTAIASAIAALQAAAGAGKPLDFTAINNELAASAAASAAVAAAVSATASLVPAAPAPAPAPPAA